MVTERVVLVTGGNRGIGEGFIEELLEQDAAKVYVGSRDVTEAEAVAIVTVNDGGLISRIDEWLDPAPLAPLFA